MKQGLAVTAFNAAAQRYHQFLCARTVLRGLMGTDIAADFEALAQPFPIY